MQSFLFRLNTANVKLKKLQSGTVYTRYEPAVVTSNWPPPAVNAQSDDDLSLSGVHFVENGAIVNYNASPAIPLQTITTTQVIKYF